VAKSQRKGSLERPRSRLKDNIKSDLKEDGRARSGKILLKLGISCGLL
jgi:hypothetical protein